MYVRIKHGPNRYCAHILLSRPPPQGVHISLVAPESSKTSDRSRNHGDGTWVGPFWYSPGLRGYRVLRRVKCRLPKNGRLSSNITKPDTYRNVQIYRDSLFNTLNQTQNKSVRNSSFFAPVTLYSPRGARQTMPPSLSIGSSRRNARFESSACVGFGADWAATHQK